MTAPLSRSRGVDKLPRMMYNTIIGDARLKKDETLHEGNGHKPAFIMHRPVHNSTKAPTTGALYQNCRLFSKSQVERPGILFLYLLNYTFQQICRYGIIIGAIPTWIFTAVNSLRDINSQTLSGSCMPPVMGGIFLLDKGNVPFFQFLPVDFVHLFLSCFIFKLILAHLAGKYHGHYLYVCFTQCCCQYPCDRTGD